ARHLDTDVGLCLSPLVPPALVVGLAAAAILQLSFSRFVPLPVAPSIFVFSPVWLHADCVASARSGGLFLPYCEPALGVISS
ncbi:unnamed protein product, partial [Polarella glacialis]